MGLAESMISFFHTRDYMSVIQVPYEADPSIMESGEPWEPTIWCLCSITVASPIVSP